MVATPRAIVVVVVLPPLNFQVRDREEAARISNAYAPEHLIVNVQDAEAWLPLLDNAGSVFLGRCVSRLGLGAPDSACVWDRGRQGRRFQREPHPTPLGAAGVGSVSVPSPHSPAQVDA